MSQRLGSIAALFVSLIGIWSPGCTSGAAAAAQRRPNIVIIVADDLGWNTVGYHQGFAATPNIDRIARAGVELDRFYVSPMCSPTRAGLMTGRYPMRFGMAQSVVRPWMKHGLPPEERTLPEALGEAGYAHRGAFGKWHLGHLASQWHPLSQGFTRYKGCFNGAADYFTRVREGQIDWHENWQDVKEEGYTTDLIADGAASYIKQHAKEGPFLCYVAFTAPHEPLQAPQQYLAKYAGLDDTPNDGKPSPKQTLAAMMTCMDDGIGRIIKSIEEAGIAKDTLIWFMSDNGGIRRIRGTNTPLRDGKLTVYEGGVRVPSVAWWPGVIEGGRKNSTPVMFVDVMPTLLRVCGAAPGKGLDGRDVFDVLAGKTAGEEIRRDLYFFHAQGARDKEHLAVISADDWKLVVIGPDVRGEGGYQTEKHTVELFHLAEDPLEKTDLAAREGEGGQRVKDLAAKLVAFRKSEPPGAMPAVNRKPAGFEPPPQWRNAPGK